MTGLLDFRRVEVEGVRQWFRPGIDVLDIGAGSGYQSSLMAAWGCNVAAIDVHRHRDTGASHHPVDLYDGGVFPQPSASIDLAFSSNVLEHVRDQPRFLSEVRRVLRPAGLAIHIVPTASWRLWTSLGRYPDALLRLANRRAPALERGEPDAPTAAELPPRTPADWIWGRAHGEYESAVKEMRAYRRAAWTQLFRENGFQVIDARTNGLFYTGHTLLPWLSLRRRHALASALGSACHVFVMRSS